MSNIQKIRKTDYIFLKRKRKKCVEYISGRYRCKEVFNEKCLVSYKFEDTSMLKYLF